MPSDVCAIHYVRAAFTQTYELSFAWSYEKMQNTLEGCVTAV